MPNKIRRLLIGAEVKFQHAYVVGNPQDMYFKGVKKQAIIHSIEETKKHYIISIFINDEVQEWQKRPKNDITTVEYEIEG
jgi:hypothetical protein